MSSLDISYHQIFSGNKGCNAYFITEHKRHVHHLIYNVSRDHRKTWERKELHQNVEQDHDYGLEKFECNKITQLKRNALASRGIEI